MTSAVGRRHSRFRPCIDLHHGKVKQIVGGSLRDAQDGKGDDEQTLTTNFVAEHPPSYYAELYARHNLIGGGIDADNARLWLERGAEKVIVTSYLFPDCKFSFERLLTLEKIVGRDRLVVDISCRRREQGWVVAMNRWQDLTDMVVSKESVDLISSHCSYVCCADSSENY